MYVCWFVAISVLVFKTKLFVHFGQGLPLYLVVVIKLIVGFYTIVVLV